MSTQRGKLEAIQEVVSQGASEVGLRRLKNFLLDPDPEVRAYSLEALVLDLKQKSEAMAATCYRILKSDLDEEVRQTAASCLSSIYLSSKDLQHFRRIKALLESGGETNLVRSALYNCLLAIGGVHPRDWWGLLGPRRLFSLQEIDWERISALEAELEEQSRGERGEA